MASQSIAPDAVGAASTRVAALLAAKGVHAGERVGVLLPDVPHLTTVVSGIGRLGAVPVRMTAVHTERDVASRLSESGARLLFAWHEWAEIAHAGTEAAGAECVLVEPGPFEVLLRRASEATAPS